MVMESETLILPILPWTRVPPRNYNKKVTSGRHSIIRPAYLEMDGETDKSEVDELTKRGVTTIETPFGQEGSDADPGLTSKIDMKHAWVVGVLQVSEGIIPDLPRACSLTWSFKILGI